MQTRPRGKTLDKRDPSDVERNTLRRKKKQESGLGMFQGTICPSEGGEAKDFVPPPKGAERSEC